jgi:hypothetical protein
MLKKIGKIFFIILFFSNYILSADIQVSASVSDTEVEVDEQFTYSVTVSGNVANVPRPTLPQLPDFRVYSSGTSSSFQFVNGVISSSITYNYVLVPLKEGTFTIGEAKIEFGGQEYKTQPITIKVLPKGTKPKVHKPRQPSLEEQLFRQNEEGVLFVKAVVNKTTAYVNEPITLKYKLYFKNVAIAQYGVREFPSFAGFWVEDVPPPKQRTRKVETYNGVQYYTIELETKILFPTSSGNYTIGKASFEFLIEDFFSFFGKKVARDTEPINIKVLPLPEKGKPANFKGDVGSYSISASVTAKEIKQNNPFILKVIIQGNGNIKTITEPQMPELQNFKLYDSRSSINVQKTSDSVTGNKTFEYILIPLSAGEFEIPPFKYSFFNPFTKEYKTIQTKPFKLKVKPAPASSTTYVQSQFSYSPSEVTLLGKDIRFIKENIKIKNYKPFIYKKKIFIFLLIFPLILLVAGYFYYRYKFRLETDIKFARASRAYKLATKRIKEIEKKLKLNHLKNIESDFEKLITGYISDKLNIPYSSIIIDEIKKLLKSRNISSEIINMVDDIYTKINMIKYSPTKFHREELNELLNDSVKVINQFEELKV